MNPQSPEHTSFFKVFFTNKKLILSGFFVFFFLAVIVFYIYTNLAQYIKDEGQVNNRFETINAIRELNNAILTAETSQRGFLLTGDEKYLSEYNSFYTNIYKEKLPNLQKNIERDLDSTEDLKNFSILKTDIDTRLVFLKQNIDIRKQKGLDATIESLKLNSSQESMDLIQSDLDTIVKLETKDLNNQLTVAQKQSQAAIFIITIAVLSAAITGLIAFFIIIFYQSKKTKLEKRLVESEKQYRSIFENFQDVYYKSDLSGNILIVSPSIENYTGIKPSDLIGKNSAIFYFNPHEREELIKQLSISGRVFNFPLMMHGKANTAINASASSHFLYDENHKPIAIEGTLRDVTQQKKMEEALKARTEEAERLSSIAVNRELKMIELKDEIAKLKEKVSS